MSATVELKATEVVIRLLPLLKEYAEKMADLAERVPRILAQLMNLSVLQEPMALEIGRIVCLHDTLAKPVTDVAREASGLIEHAAVEHYLRAELKLRLDELEEHIRFSEVSVGELTKKLTARRGQAEIVRQLIERSGRYKAPF